MQSVSYENSMDWAVPYFQTLYRKHQNRSADKPNNNICSEEKCLLQAAVPFYVYPEHVLFSDRRFDISNLTRNTLDKDPRVLPTRHREGVFYEIAILHALMNHPLRTESQQDAQLFILPISFGAMLFDDDATQNQKRLLLQEIRKNLRTTLAPFSDHGKPHVLISMTSPIFNPHHRQNAGRPVDVFYKAVQRVIVARSDDYIGANYCYRHKVRPANDFRGYDEQFATLLPITEYQFSVGLGGEARHLPLIVPTWNKFQNATLFVFYHIRPTPFLCHSTAYRQAPVRNVSLEALPRSSIGWDIPAHEWRQGFLDAKFCLVIRGDTPHSHSLFNAIKVGCIPVVVSDWYPFFAPPFPTTLDMRDFCVFIPEDYFLSHPQEALQRLQHIPDHVIQAKLKAMEWAQRVVLVEHPHSLFVPAFVREAVASLSRPASLVLRDEVERNRSYH